MLADALIVKFGELMGMLNTVSSGEELSNELREDKLLQENIKSAVSYLTPFIPFMGIVSSGATLGKHVMKHKKDFLKSLLKIFFQLSAES